MFVPKPCAQGHSSSFVSHSATHDLGKTHTQKFSSAVIEVSNLGSCFVFIAVFLAVSVMPYLMASPSRPL